MSSDIPSPAKMRAQGREWATASGVFHPPSLDTNYPDPDDARKVSLSVTRSLRFTSLTQPSASQTESRSNHWAIFWEVGTAIDPVEGEPKRQSTIIRRIELVIERGQVSGQGPPVAKYVYWCPKTTHLGQRTAGPFTSFPLGTLSKDARDELERLAGAVPVFDPELAKDWNCQDWLKELLDNAVKAGVIDSATCDIAVKSAVEIQPIFL
ncbi:hypothetical protein OF83DRAFT_882017 [Amylostereum chailletii]|nr:hypothetical protein OF83DRAFT_882017 [Amylostereum chailletii]